MKQKTDLQELEAFLSGYWLTDLANFSAFLFEKIPDVNWVGFYLSDGKNLDSVHSAENRPAWKFLLKREFADMRLRKQRP